MAIRYATGWKPDRLDHRDLIYTPPSAVDPSTSIDLRPLMPPIYDQGQLGSCVGNGTAAAFEYALGRESARHIFTPSRLFIYYNARALEGTTNQDAGCEIRDAVKSLNAVGVIPESEWPYDANQFAAHPPASLYPEAMKSRLVTYARVGQFAEHILACLTHHGPVVFGSSVFSAINDAPGGHIPMPRYDDQPEGGHCMMIVGWKPDSHEYIIRNSWGTEWGDAGYGYMPAAYIHNSSLTDDLWVLWLVEKDKAEAA